ncbi:M28 family peptidase [Brevundimonas sp. 2R-24]|uniref:M28 family peptidase n=1 Tax=Peiella sedimenti TaxID=3061083 RepID=A0ABT8SKL9_9CAUL|nr:M28 family peptidase [Caulobacteraceae bacterium XZ-24]
MSFRKFIAAAGLATVLAISGQAQAQQGFEPSLRQIQADMYFLADDAMLGRMPGEPGYDIAANYVAARFRALGLQPGGDNGSYHQSVPLLRFRAADDGRLTLTGADGSTEVLTPRVDYVAGSNPLSETTNVSAPLVFAGYGIVGAGRDDYAGLDVRGKIVVVLSSAPMGLQTEERAHVADASFKRRTAEARGAVGMVVVYPGRAGEPEAFAQRTTIDRTMTWRNPQGRTGYGGDGAPYLAGFGRAGAEKLFAGSDLSVEEIWAAAATPEGRVGSGELRTRLSAELRNTLTDIPSANVVGIIPGSDPEVADEYIILSAHVDHIGTRSMGEGDRINNGFVDNSSGVAAMLEAARGFMETSPPRRSVMFIGLTAEEQGLVGADYYANNPTVPLEQIAANVNLDMPVLTYDFSDVVVFGANRSSIGPSIERAGARIGIGVAEDFLPEEGLFTRSDHYRFVVVGVPSVFLMTGPGNGGREAFADFLRTHYHRPGDQPDLPISWDAALRFASLNYQIARELADQPERPSWNEGDFFNPETHR